MRPVTEGTQPAGPAHADRDGAPGAEDHSTIRVDQTGRPTHESGSVGIPADRDGRGITDHRASSDPPHVAAILADGGRALDIGSISHRQGSTRNGQAGNGEERRPGDASRSPRDLLGTSPERTGNLLLDALPPPDREILLRRTRVVRLEPEEVVVDAGQRIDRVLFPATAVISLLTTLSDGTAVETATVGREGILGVAVFLQDDRAPNSRAIVQLAGTALAIGADDFRACLAATGKLESLMYSYTRALLLQFGQSVACTASHTISQRLARWLLQTTDRVGSDTVDLTQEFVAGILGVRRASVTDSLRGLHLTGAIETRRGSIEIVDRARLREAACECYAFLHEEYGRIYGAP